MKPCRKCGASDRSKSTGRCRPCHASHPSRFTEAYKARARVKSAEWRKENPEKFKESYIRLNAAYNNTDRGRRVRRARSINAAYGITLEDYEDMLEAQAGLCNICTNPMSPNNRNTHIDHCHITGKVRGLLCLSCNLGIGYLKDSALLASGALNYLTEQ